jgi:hypothetical protein
MALLGRISAVLTANTQDFTRQIGTARREIQDFARQARGVQFNLNTRSLDGTLTQLQRFQRTIREIQQLQARGVDAGLPNANRLRDQFRAFEDVGRPLTAVKNQIEGLSNTVQAELYPALERVQAGFRNLYSEIDAGTTTYDRSAARIENLQRRITALGRATAAAGDFSNLAKSLNANNAGASFFQPRAKESLQRSLELRNQAQNVPARFRGGAFADLSVEAERNADDIERAAARVAAAQLRIAERGETPANLVQRGRAQAELDNLTNRQTAINASFQRELTSAQIQQVVSPEAERQVDSLIERFAKLSAKLREGNDTRFENLIASVGRVVEQLNRGEVSARRAKVAVEALAGADFAKSFNSAGFDKATNSLKTDSEQALDEISKNFSAQRKNVIANVGALGLIGPDRTRRIGEINTQEDIARARVGFNSNVLESVSSLDTKTKQLDNAGLRSQFENIRKLAIDANSSLNAAFNAKPEDASAALDNYNLKLSALNKTLDNFEQKVSSAETAQKRFSQFLSISGSRSDKLGSSLTRFATDIAATRQLAGNLPASNASGRAEIERRIESDIQFADRIATAQQRISDSKRLSESQKSSRRRRLDDIVAARRQESVGVLVQNSEGTITRARANQVMDRFARNQGSVGLGGAASAQLALQQGLFAIDDLISSTGGLEYKLRAVGNNITQLGLLLGQSGLIPGLSATTGLFIGLAAVMGGQVASAIARFTADSGSAEAGLDSLNEALKRSKSLAQELAEAFKSISSQVGDLGLSDQAASVAKLDKSVQELRKKFRESNTERLAVGDEEVQRQRAIIGTTEKKIQETSDVGERTRLQIQLERAKLQEQGRLGAIENQRGISPQAAVEAAANARLRVASAEINARFSAVTAGGGGVAAAAGADELRRAALERASGEAEEFKKRLGGVVAAQGNESDRIFRARDVLDAQILEIEQSITTGFSGLLDATNKEKTKQLAVLQQARNSLEKDVVTAAQDLAINITEESIRASKKIGDSQKQISDAISAGVPSAYSLGTAFDALVTDLGKAQEKVVAAGLSGNLRGVERAKVEVSNIMQQISARQDELSAINAVTIAVSKFEDALQSAARSVESNLQSSIDARDSARQDNAFLGTKESATALARADGFVSEQENLAARAKSEIAAAKERFAQESLIARDAALASEAKANEGRIRASARAAGIDTNGRNYQEIADEFTAKGLEAQAKDAISVGVRQGEIKAALGVGAQDFWSAVADILERSSLQASDAVKRATDAAEIDRQLNTVGVLAQGSRESLVRRRAELESQAIAQDPNVIGAVDASAVESLRAQSVARGMQAAMTTSEKAGMELATKLRDISEYFVDRIDQNNGLAAPGMVEDMTTRQKRVADEAMRQTAPAIFSMADQVANAVLQGPSRASLQAMDINTAQGGSELSRLLRGDDSAKNQNLVELQKQSTALTELVTIARENGAPPGVFDN